MMPRAPQYTSFSLAAIWTCDGKGDRRDRIGKRHAQKKFHVWFLTTLREHIDCAAEGGACSLESIFEIHALT